VEFEIERFQSEPQLSQGETMRELTMNDLSMRELTAQEVHQVSGGWSIFGAALTLAGVVVGIAAAVVGGPIGVALGIVAIGVGGLAYAAELYDSLLEGEVTVGPMEEYYFPDANDVYEQEMGWSTFYNTYVWDGCGC
jgi:lactobin A/cerein 7B family class IIb bacteriocin